MLYVSVYVCVSKQSFELRKRLVNKGKGRKARRVGNRYCWLCTIGNNNRLLNLLNVDALQSWMDCRCWWMCGQ